MNFSYNIEAKKRATSLSINSDLIRVAKEYKINLSKALETYLIELIRKKELQEWKKENSSAIKKYNEQVAKHGVFSDGLRGF